MRGDPASGTVDRMGSRAARMILPVLAGAAAIAGCSTTELSSPQADGQDPETSLPAGGGPVTSAKAGQIATDRFGGRVLNIEPDTANGRPTWEVEIADSREGRIEVDVSQQDGAIVEMERD